MKSIKIKCILMGKLWRIMDNYNWAGMDFDLKNFIKRCVCCGKLELLQINKSTGVANVEETLVPFF